MNFNDMMIPLDKRKELEENRTKIVILENNQAYLKESIRLLFAELKGYARSMSDDGIREIIKNYEKLGE